jgi:hypothetical protein
MFKVGILGSDNSHALAFAKRINFVNEKTGEYLFPDVKITSIYGVEKERTEYVANEGKIEFIAEKPEDLMDKVDAVMVVFRHGDLHAPYAIPFIEKGIPTWIDKPFTNKVSDAKKIIEAAKKYNTLVTGGTSVKYSYDILMLKNSLENDQNMGRIISGSLNHTASLENEYGGLYFYGAHHAEAAMKIFGYDAKSVVADVNGKNIIVIVKYDRYQVVIQYLETNPKSIGIVFGEKKTVVREIDSSLGYTLALEEFVGMLRTKKMPFPLEELLAPTVLLNAMIKSIETKKEVFLSELA